MLVRFAAVMVLVLSLGLHWAFLQSVAWVGMVVSYSRDASFTNAVSKTFDGNHPCNLCKIVKQGREQEKQERQQQIKPESKLDFALLWENSAFVFRPARDSIALVFAAAPLRCESPPKPRPRHLSVHTSA